MDVSSDDTASIVRTIHSDTGWAALQHGISAAFALVPWQFAGEERSGVQSSFERDVAPVKLQLKDMYFKWNHCFMKRGASQLLSNIGAHAHGVGHGGPRGLSELVAPMSFM